MMLCKTALASLRQSSSSVHLKQLALFGIFSGTWGWLLSSTVFVLWNPSFWILLASLSGLFWALRLEGSCILGTDSGFGFEFLRLFSWPCLFVHRPRFAFCQNCPLHGLVAATNRLHIYMQRHQLHSLACGCLEGEGMSHVLTHRNFEEVWIEPLRGGGMAEKCVRSRVFGAVFK